MRKTWYGFVKLQSIDLTHTCNVALQMSVSTQQSIWKESSAFHWISHDSWWSTWRFIFVFPIRSVGSKYLSIEHFCTSASFVVMPIFSYVFENGNGKWKLPLKTKIFFIDTKSHPGYEIHSLFLLHLVYCLGFISLGENCFIQHFLLFCILFMIYLLIYSMHVQPLIWRFSFSAFTCGLSWIFVSCIAWKLERPPLERRNKSNRPIYENAWFRTRGHSCELNRIED